MPDLAEAKYCYIRSHQAFLGSASVAELMRRADTLMRKDDAMPRKLLRKLLRTTGITSKGRDTSASKERYRISDRISLPLDATQVRLFLPDTWRPEPKAWMLTATDARTATRESAEITSWSYSGIVEEHYQYVLQPEEGASHSVHPLEFDAPIREVSISLVQWQPKQKTNNLPTRIAWRATDPGGRQFAGWLELS